jgi:hypothetical protein
MCVSFIHTHSRFLKSGKCHIQHHEKGIHQVLCLMQWGDQSCIPTISWAYRSSILLHHRRCLAPLKHTSNLIASGCICTHSQLSGWKISCLTCKLSIL